MIRRMRVVDRCLAGIAAAILVCASGSAAAPPPTQAATPDPAAVQALIAAVDTQLGQVRSNGSIDDYQGAIAYAVDQSGAPCPVVSAALKGVLARPNIGRALARAASAVAANCAVGSGTGGVGAGQGTPGALSSGPSIGGGGASNYSNP